MHLPPVSPPTQLCRSSVQGSGPTPPNITLIPDSSSTGASSSMPLLTQRVQVAYGQPPARPLLPCQSAADTGSCRAVAFDGEGNDLSGEIEVVDASECVGTVLAQSLAAGPGGMAAAAAASAQVAAGAADVAAAVPAAPCWPCDLTLAQAGQCLPGRYNLSFSGGRADLHWNGWVPSLGPVPCLDAVPSSAHLGVRVFGHLGRLLRKCPG